MRSFSKHSAGRLSAANWPGSKPDMRGYSKPIRALAEAARYATGDAHALSPYSSSLSEASSIFFLAAAVSIFLNSLLRFSIS